MFKPTKSVVKPLPDPEDDSPEYIEARGRYATIRGRVSGLQVKAKGIELALSLATSTNGGQGMPDHLRAEAEPFLKIAKGRPARLRAMLDDIEDELDAAGSELLRERALWDAAQRQETARRAVTLQPEHRAAVREIAELLPKLCRALEIEADVRRQLRPGLSSSFLPDCSLSVCLGSPAAHGSAAWAWLKKVRGLGILEA